MPRPVSSPTTISPQRGPAPRARRPSSSGRPESRLGRVDPAQLAAPGVELPKPPFPQPQRTRHGEAVPGGRRYAESRAQVLWEADHGRLRFGLDGTGNAAPILVARLVNPGAWDGAQSIIPIA
jgi:hypothetical protein